MTDRRGAPSARTWIIAAAELVGALVLARILVWTDRPAGHRHEPGMAPTHGMAPMSDVPKPFAPQAQWTWPVLTVGVLAIAAFIWWVSRRQIVVAVVGATAAIICMASHPVRVLAAQSHLVAMIVLEVQLVAVPLWILTVLPSAADTGRRGCRRAGWMLLSGGSALAYAALLIAIHLPGGHHHGGARNVVPLWLAIAASIIGIVYWFGVLRTAAVLPLKIRRISLLAAQEIAALVGLLSLFGAWGVPGVAGPLKISVAWDQALGGLVMLVTCAAVAIPISRRLHSDSSTPSATESR
ncbi:hypothetical protein QRB36_04510 [Mycobacterium marseillense]|nr:MULTISPECIES: hypothetical protein [Mycobacterium avium complex (MAC)]MDM3973425.1 hypothetical protein [Mycobacterium marseillense]